MELALAEVNDLVQRRTKQNDAEARKTVRGFRALAAGMKELMRLLNEAYPDDQGPEIVLVYRAAECLAFVIDPFSVFSTKLSRSTVLLSRTTCERRLVRFGDLAAKLPDRLRPIWLAYTEAYERDLEAAAEQEKETAASWASVDSDGLAVY